MLNSIGYRSLSACSSSMSRQVGGREVGTGCGKLRVPPNPRNLIGNEGSQRQLGIVTRNLCHST